ncbi:MAG: C45 family autoproteolytic acyltransferase/hydrolase, partial [Planctomycetota bacterium]|nr:C45 family autoproteolytic acyltransferase/hydrolase [Planctomycetota bacterium]
MDDTQPLRQPFPVECTGSANEMGEQQGRALRDSIRLVRPMLRKLDAFCLQKPAWMPFPAYVWMAERKSRSFLEPPLAERHPQSLARLRGIARGASVGIPTLLLSNALESSLSSLGDCTVSLGGCSAVAVRNTRSHDAQPVIAKNFDYLPLVQPFYILRRSRPASGLASLEFTMAPFAGAIDGVNEAGLCITYNYAFTRDAPLRPSPPLSILIGEALNQCSTVVEALDWITSRTRWGSGMLMLADAGGDVASLEISNTVHGVRRLPDGEDCL